MRYQTSDYVYYMIRQITLTAFTISILLIITGSAQARPKDLDRDGLSNKAEKKLKTNPRRADTDFDGLKDRAEIKIKTNPRKADSDGDGLKDGLEVRDGLNPRDRDSDEDGHRDGRELRGRVIGLNDSEMTIERKNRRTVSFLVDEATFLEGVDINSDNQLTLADFGPGAFIEASIYDGRAKNLELIIKKKEVKGFIESVEGNQVTLLLPRRAQVTFEVNLNTYLRSPDRDSNGIIDLNDLLVGDRVEVYLNQERNVALSMQVKYEDDQYGDDDGYEEKDQDEAKGEITLIEGSQVTVSRKGYAVTFSVDESTYFQIENINGDSVSDLGDLVVGDIVEVKLVDGVALSIKKKLFKKEDYFEFEGILESFDEDEVLISQGPLAKVLIITPLTEFEGPDRDLSGDISIADFNVGDFVEAEFDENDNLLELSFEGSEDDSEDDSFDD